MAGRRLWWRSRRSSGLSNAPSRWSSREDGASGCSTSPGFPPSRAWISAASTGSSTSPCPDAGPDSGPRAGEVDARAPVHAAGGEAEVVGVEGHCGDARPTNPLGQPPGRQPLPDAPQPVDAAALIVPLGGQLSEQPAQPPSTGRGPWGRGQGGAPLSPVGPGRGAFGTGGSKDRHPVTPCRCDEP